MILLLPPNHDVAWLLNVGRRMLDGDRMFVDIVETNPPLIVWLSTFIVGSAKVLGIAPLQLYRVVVITAAAVSAFACYRIARPGGEERAVIIGLGAALITLALPGYDFGQREHLLIILALPYFISAAMYLHHSGESRVATGVAAGLGFALKPHFLPAWIAAEVLLASKRGSGALRRAEGMAVLTTLIAYAALVLVFAPDYPTQAARLAPLYYGFAIKPLATLLGDPRFEAVAIVMALTLTVVFLRRSRDDSVLVVVEAAALMLTGAVLLQRKGFSYHWYPALSLTLLATIIAVSSLTSRAPKVVGGTLFLAIPLVSMQMTQTAWIFAENSVNRLREVTEAIDESARGRPVLPLTLRGQESLLSATEVLGLRWDSPYPFPWILGAADSRPAIKREVLDGMWRLVNKHPPGALVVDHGGSRGSATYFASDPRFALLLSRCQWKAEVADLRICELP